MTATALSPCSSCARHVRRSEAACPFCGVALALDAGAAVRLAGERLGRAAIFSLGAAAITSVVGCAMSHERGPVPIAEHDAGSFIGAYGAPALGDAALGDAALGDAAAFEEQDAGAPMTHYGAPPPVEDAGPDADLGCCNADYGGPPWP
jgi:hypothetical protein